VRSNKAVSLLLIGLSLTSALFGAPKALGKQRKPVTLKTVLESVADVLPIATPNNMSLAVVSSTDAIVAIEVSGNNRVASQFVIDASMIRIGDEPNPNRISRAVRNLQSLGIFKDISTRFRREPRGKVLTLIVTENPTIDHVVFQGGTVFKDGDLGPKIGSQPNDIVNLVQIRKDLKLIEKAYADAGYDQAKVMSFDIPDGRLGDLVFHISEGVLESVSVTGNTKTKDYVIIREMVSKPGMPVRRATLQQDYQRIFNLGYFTGLNPEIRPGVSPNTMELTWVVDEKESSGTFALGAGFSPTAGFSFFSNIFWDNLFGTGQLVSAKTQFGRSSTYELKYSNPWMWDDRKSFTVRTWLRDGQVDQFLAGSSSVGYRNENSFGTDVEIGWPFSYEFYSTHTVKYESVRLKDVNKSYTLTSYALGLVYDTRDVRFNPLNGAFYTFRIEKSIKYDSGGLDITRVDVDIRNFTKVADQQTIATRLAVGYLSSPQIDDQDLFLREYYRVGGANTVRGWNDYYPFSIGSKQVLTSLEYRYLLNDTFTVVLFADVGYSTSGSIFNIAKARMGKGIGIRFNIPMLGPVRLDWGINDESTSMVHFSFGQTF